MHKNLWVEVNQYIDEFLDDNLNMNISVEDENEDDDENDDDDGDDDFYFHHDNGEFTILTTEPCSFQKPSTQAANDA